MECLTYSQKANSYPEGQHYKISDEKSNQPNKSESPGDEFIVSVGSCQQIPGLEFHKQMKYQYPIFQFHFDTQFLLKEYQKYL